MKLCKNSINRGMENHEIVFMTKSGFEYIDKQYNGGFFFNKNYIFPIPYEINHVYGISEKECYERYRSYEILAIARADFPFKGYLLGIVDSLDEIVLHCPMVKVTIVSFGPHEEVLRKKIDELPYDLRKHISCEGKILYSELSRYYKKAKVYLGMGSTVYEASSYGLPSIIAESYTNELNLCQQLARWNMEIEATDHERFSKDLSVLYSVLSMPWDDYFHECKLARKVFVENHDMDCVMDRMFNWCSILK